MCGFLFVLPAASQAWDSTALFWPVHHDPMEVVPAPMLGEGMSSASAAQALSDLWGHL